MFGKGLTRCRLVPWLCLSFPPVERLDVVRILFLAADVVAATSAAGLDHAFFPLFFYDDDHEDTGVCAH